jgi:uncharacterized protein YecE (DUF72 family)
MIYFGCSQWGYGNWTGKIYPKGVKAGRRLYHYSHNFNAVELNPTYHDYVDAETIRHWRGEVNAGFKFCPKFPKIISHDKMLYGVKELTGDFIERVSFFNDSLGRSFLQLHPDFSPKEMNVLNDFLKLLPKDFRLSVELRPFWLEFDNTLSEALGVLRENNAGVVIVDSLETRKFINKIKLTDHAAFIRFIAYGHETDFARLDDWINLIGMWKSKGLPEIYFFLHFPDESSDLGFLEYAMEKFEELKNTSI